MNPIDHFEVVGSRAFYRPAGRVSFEQAVELVAQALKQARGLHMASMLVNLHGLTGMGVPSIFARHAMAVKWVESAGPELHVAVVTRPEFVDPDKIGVIMAQNRGASGDVFTNESAALTWLDSRPRKHGG